MDLFAGSRNIQRLVDDHYQSLYRFAYRLTGNAAEAEDLTQETYCKAQANLLQLRDVERAKAWLFKILRNVYLQKARLSKRQPCLSLEEIGELPERSTKSRDIEPEQLQKALDELPEGFRAPLVLYYFEEFSYRDIAEQMDIPIGTVMSRLARAKGHLRAQLLQSDSAVVLNERRATGGL
jgi:RNA polymerase sigma-70 factor (ECF subfamily)